MRLKIFYDDGAAQTWAVRVVFNGDQFGHNFCLTHKEAEPMVEFYDTRHEHTDYGQFVSRYYASTLLEHEPAMLRLDTGVPSWHIGEDCMARITDWLRQIGLV